MSEPLSQTIADSFAIGLVLGIINGISKKTVTIIWIIAAVLFLTIVIFADGTSRMSQMWEVGNWIAMIITVNIAFLIGNSGIDIIKDTFKKRK